MNEGHPGRPIIRLADPALFSGHSGQNTARWAAMRDAVRAGLTVYLPLATYRLKNTYTDGSSVDSIRTYAKRDGVRASIRTGPGGDGTWGVFIRNADA